MSAIPSLAVFVVAFSVVISPPVFASSPTIIEGADWETSWEHYLLEGQTFGENSVFLSHRMAPFPGSRLIQARAEDSPTESQTVEASGFFRDPNRLGAESGPGIYAVEIASWSGSSSNLGNQTATGIGLFSTSESPGQTIDFQINNEALILGAWVENSQRGARDRLTIFYRNPDGELLTTSIEEVQAKQLDEEPNVLQFPAYGGRTDMITYTLRLDVSQDSVRVRLLRDGLEGEVLGSFDSGEIPVAPNPSGFPGWRALATASGSGQVANQAFDRFQIQIPPDSPNEN